MTKTNGFWKRLGALLLAFALVVSMCPVKASAASDVYPLTLELERVNAKEKYESYLDGGTWDTDLLGAVPTQEPNYTYVYLAKVPNVKDKSKIQFYWAVSYDNEGKAIYGNAVQDNDVYLSTTQDFARASYTSNTEEKVTMKVICDGLTLTGVLTTEETEHTYEWKGYTEGWIGDLKYGVPVTLGKFMTDANNGYDGAEEKEPSDEWNGEYFTTVDGYHVPSAKTNNKVTLVTRAVKAGIGNGVVRFEEKLEGTITYPKYEPVFKVAGTEYKPGSKVYLAKDAEMTITVDNTNLGAVMMPTVEGVTWKLNEETNQWVGTMSKAKTVELGDEKIEVIVDTQKPKFDNVMAYMNGENAVVQFDVTALSGVKTVTINGKEQNAEAASVVNNVHSYAITVPGMKEGDTAAIEVTSMAGAPQTVTATVGADLYFGTALVGATLVDETNNIVTIDDANAHVKVYLYGAKVGGVGVPSVTSVEEKHGEKTTDVTGTEAGQWTKIYALGTSGNASGITLTAKDEQGRSVENFPVPVYIVDSEAPTYQITVNGAPYDNSNEITTNETTTVTVTVTDDVMLPAVDEDDVVQFTGINVDEKVKFTKNDAGKYEASIVLTGDPAEQKLTGITSTVSDAAGRPVHISESPVITVDKTAPVVEVTFSENVEGIYKSTQDGKIYLKLKNKVTDDAAEKDEEKETVVMSWTYNDFTDGEKSGQISMPVSKHQTAVLNYEIPAQDELGNVAASVNVIVGDTTQKLTAVKKDDGVSYFMGALHADRRIPGSSEKDIPKVSFKLDEHPAGRLDDQDVYATNFNVQAFISDISETPDADSGMYSVSWAVEGSDKLAIEGVPTGENGLAADGQYDFTVAIKNGDAVEVKDVVLKVTVKDNAGNEFTHTSQKFAVDNCAPRVTVTKAGEGKYVDDVEYIKSAMTYEVTVEDMFLDTSNVAIKDSASGVAVAESKKTDSVHTYTVSVAGDLKADDITITAKDKAEHSQFNEGAAVDEDFKFENGTYVNKNTVIFDNEAPLVLVTRDNEPINYTETTDYHNQAVTYTFIVTDEHLSNKGTPAKLDISYTIGGTVTNVGLSASAENMLIWDELTGSYTYSFTLADETKTLTDMKIEVNDNAGNDHLMDAATNCLPFANGIYTGRDAIVDTVKPVVTVERTNTSNTTDNTVTAVNKTDGYAYFDEDVKYTITVEEANFDLNSEITLEGDNLPGVTLTKDPVVDGRYIYSFVLLNTAKLNNIKINVIDYANHKPETINENVDDEAYQGNGDYQWTADSKHVIVDQTAPKATLAITSTQDVLGSYYTYEKDGIEYYYLKLKNPSDDPNTKEEFKGDVTVTATLTVKDRNLLKLEGYLVNNDGITESSTADEKHKGWNLDHIEVNDETCVATYTTLIPVSYDDTELLKIDLSVKDAVNKTLETVTVNPVNNSVLPDGIKLEGKPFVISGEKVTSNIVLDRRSPNGGETRPPEIKIVPVKGTTLRTAGENSVELYNSVPSFYVDVREDMAGKDQVLHAGLASLNVSMTHDGPDRGELLEFTNVEKAFEPGSYSDPDNYYTFKNGTAIGECNNYILTAVAVDNVGNKTTVSRKFAVDTMAPSVNVEYNADATVLNELYFNKDRIATITVEDINFSDALTKIETQVDPSDWAHSDDNKIHTATCVYNTDGDYTFAMYSKDLAGNETGDDQVKYDGAAPKKFTVDKTNPVITVSFSPKHTNEFGGRWYYADLTTATVTIDEHNFRASDVAPVFRLAGNVINYVKLGDFTSAGDTHKANAAFSDGNDYDFTITYSDLAGNPAIPYNTDPHFSVDSKDPKIAMTRGDMTADGVNVVSGDIDLQFRITDEEKNLAGYTVKLTHLNNEFETYVITEKDNYRDWFSVDKQDDENTIYVTMANLPKEKEYDGIYTIEITGIDHAGNKTVMDVITYSLNRFGSTFHVDDAYTAQFLKLGADGITYHNSVDNKLIVKEINPNEVFHTVENKTVRGSMLTVVANGVSRQLVEGKDYTMTVVPDHKETGDKVETWYIYTYEIDPSVFQDENGFISGRYAILFYSEDAAGNKNTNEANISSTVQENANGEYTGKMEFVLDTMPPVITTTGIESNKVYNAEFQRMEILVSDTTPTGIQVFLNGTEVALSDAALADTAAWLVLDELTGVYTLNVPEQNELFGSQYVSVIAKDAAGNAAEALVEDFNVSTSLLVRLVHNGWIIVGGGLGIAALIFLLIQWKKKKV